MKAKKLIKQLKSLVKEHGDLEVIIGFFEHDEDVQIDVDIKEVTFVDDEGDEFDEAENYFEISNFDIDKAKGVKTIEIH